jgi:hypothetical protein
LRHSSFASVESSSVRPRDSTAPWPACGGHLAFCSGCAQARGTRTAELLCAMPTCQCMQCCIGHLRTAARGQLTALTVEMGSATRLARTRCTRQYAIGFFGGCTSLGDEAGACCEYRGCRMAAREPSRLCFRKWRTQWPDFILFIKHFYSELKLAIPSEYGTTSH